jgi:hypothetical protein
VVCFIVIFIFQQNGLPFIPENKGAASKSPLPPFKLKKEKLVPNQKSRTHRLIPRQQDFGIRNWTLSYETARGSHFGIFESY